MKKLLLIALAAAILTVSLTSCSRRGKYEDQLESIKDTQPDIPLEEQTAKDGFIGSPSEDYALPIIKKIGETPCFSGKTEDELKNMWRKNLRAYMFATIVVTKPLSGWENAPSATNGIPL